MQTFLAQIALLLATIAVGAFLRTVGLLNQQDAKAAGLAITYGTLPSLVLQTLLTYGFLGVEGAAIALAPFLLNVGIAGAAWYAFRERRLPERALLTGTVAGVALGSPAFGFVEAAFGPVGLHLAVLWDLGNMLSVWLLSYLVLAKGGSSIPERYVHADGGVYRGQWRAGKKHGLGVYKYPGGGEYRGRWVENLKQGPGIYYFPKGGWYEGEWREGQRKGLGLRVMRSGAIQAGEWDGMDRVQKLEPEECALAAAGAREVAKAALQVPAAQGGLSDTAAKLLTQPMLWAAAAALLFSVTTFQVPVAVDLVTAHLATAHIPLTLMVFGLNLELDLPKGRQVSDVAKGLGLRLVGPLLLAAALAATLSRRYTEAVAIAAVCSLGPISEQVPYYVQLFRMNAQIGGTIVSASRIGSLAALLVLTFSMVLATPLDALISRAGLVAAIGVSAAVVSAAAGVAAWLLSQQTQNPKARGLSLSRRIGVASQQPSQDLPAGLQTEPVAAAAKDIPPGIAWQEAEKIESEAPEASLANTELLPEGEAVEEGPSSSEGAVVSGPPEVESGSPDDLLGRAESSSGSGTADSPASSTNRPRRGRRRGGRGFQDVDEESAEPDYWAAELGYGLLGPRKEAGGSGMAARKPGWICDAVRRGKPLAKSAKPPGRSSGIRVVRQAKFLQPASGRIVAGGVVARTC